MNVLYTITIYNYDLLIFTERKCLNNKVILQMKDPFKEIREKKTKESFRLKSDLETLFVSNKVS